MSLTNTFVHLHLHTQYSLLDGAIKITELISHTKQMGMSAVAITDHGNMFGTVDFYKQAISAGIKPIFGCEVYVADKDRTDKTNRTANHLILLAKTQEGYKNLKYLVSMGYIDGFYYKPRIDKELLKKNSKGLIACSACLGGEVAKAFEHSGYEKSKKAAQNLAQCFEPEMFFLEVQNNGYKGQDKYNKALRKIGHELELPLVATNDCHYLTKEDARAHTVLMCIGHGNTLEESKGNLHYTDQLYLKTPEQMHEIFEDFPDALENTAKIARMCENVIPVRELHFPTYKIPEGMELGEYLRNKAHEMLQIRFNEFKIINKEYDEDFYKERLNRELDVICNMKFPGYFLIVMDFINHAKNEKIPVGPGRGSGAGSLVAYALRITNLDPIPLNLLFERFLNPERVSMPDFDIDFCKNRREEVIRYVTDKYGKNNVGQIATFHQLKSKSVVRDVGRVMGIPYSEVDLIAKMVPEGPKVTLKTALNDEPKLAQAIKDNPQLEELMSYAQRLENLNRHAGMHAAGIVIGDKPLWEYVPVFTAGDRCENGILISQFDMNHVESCGLVKFDFLGLKTLTVIDAAVSLINKRPDIKEPINIELLDLGDKAVYEIISKGDTWGVFQLESSGFQELLKRLKPDCFEDIIAAVALYRPGPLEGGMVDTFVECKHGRQEIKYLHPLLEEVLKETYGVIVYQEQVMMAAQILANYSLGAADNMRRVMGKKKEKEMEKEREKFVTGCCENNISNENATVIFNLIDKFAGYGFNKSHSAAYALITYQTAWLKVNYPVEFLAALLTCDRENTEKIAEYIRLAKQKNIELNPPDVNRSSINFSVSYEQTEKRSEGKIIYGLGAIKGVGDAALKTIIEARNNQEEGPFKDLFDFTNRVDLSKVNKGVIESLIKAGAFDTTIKRKDLNRGNLFGVIESAIDRGKATQKERDSGQTNLFGELISTAEDSMTESEINFQNTIMWTEREILLYEKASVGFFMSGHPMEKYEKEASRLTGITTLNILEKNANEEISIAGIINDYSERKTKAGKRLGIGSIEDLYGRTGFLVFSSSLESCSSALRSTEPILIRGRIMVDSKGESEIRQISVSEAIPLQEVRTQKTKEVQLLIDAKRFDIESVDDFKAILWKHAGRCDARLDILTENALVCLNLPKQYRLAPSDELISELEPFSGIKEIIFK